MEEIAKTAPNNLCGKVSLKTAGLGEGEEAYPSSFGRSSNRVVVARIESTQMNIPAAPQPAIARPRMRISTLGAAAQMIEPADRDEY